MSKILLDKYYTPDNIVDICLNLFFKFFRKEDISEVVEPSAGNGSFSLRIPGCVAYDIDPKDQSIMKKDFLSIELPYKPRRYFIGNPPFGDRNNLAKSFFKKCSLAGDGIGFILPVSQYNNNKSLFEMDLLHSELLPDTHYSGIKVKTCFNIFSRPKSGILNSKSIDYTLKDVTIKEYRRGSVSNLRPATYDFVMCGWGDLGRELQSGDDFVQEDYIIVNNRNYVDDVISVIRSTDWKGLYPYTTAPKITMWKIYKHLKLMLPYLS